VRNVLRRYIVNVTQIDTTLNNNKYLNNKYFKRIKYNLRLTKKIMTINVEDYNK